MRLKLSIRQRTAINDIVSKFSTMASKGGDRETATNLHRAALYVKWFNMLSPSDLRNVIIALNAFIQTFDTPQGRDFLNDYPDIPGIRNYLLTLLPEEYIQDL